MQTHKLPTLIVLLLTAAIYPAQAQSSGQLTYEVVRKVDPGNMRIMINGEQVKPGDPNFPTDIPDTRTFSQQLSFAGDHAREDRSDEGAVIRRIVETGAGAPQTTNMGRPFTEQLFVDLANQKTITLLTVGKENEAKTYRSEMPIQRADNWQVTDQTKKIAGYTCRKATVPFRKETYTVWYTTDLPLTYSPIRELTPEKGVVLLIEGSREQYKATKFTAKAVDPSTLQPVATAQLVTAAQLADIRQKASADFQQQLMSRERN